jgi:hypothetical protein
MATTSTTDEHVPGQIDMLADHHASVIADVLEHARLTWRTERELQAEIADALTRAGIAVEREVELGDDAGRIDFMSGTVGVEVKIKGATPAVARQLQRYAHSPRVAHLLLVTTRPHHLTGMPARLADVAVDVVFLTGGAW